MKQRGGDLCPEPIRFLGSVESSVRRRQRQSHPTMNTASKSAEMDLWFTAVGDPVLPSEGRSSREVNEVAGRPDRRRFQSSSSPRDEPVPGTHGPHTASHDREDAPQDAPCPTVRSEPGGCTTNAAHPSGAGASTTIKGPRTSTAPLPTVTAGESLLVVQTIESAGRHASPADVLQTSGLAPAKCTAWDYPALAGAGFDEVHLIVPSDKASVLRKALLRLSGVESVAEAGLGEFGRVQGKAPRPERMTC
jgi:hypothetical protein